VARGKILSFIRMKRHTTEDDPANPIFYPTEEALSRSALVYDFQKYLQARDGLVDGIYRLTEEGTYAFFTYDGFAQQIQEYFAQRERMMACGKAARPGVLGSLRRLLNKLFFALHRGRYTNKARPRPIPGEAGPPVGFVLGLMRSGVMRKLAAAGYPLRRIFIELKNTDRITEDQHQQLILAHQEARREVQRLHQLYRSLSGLAHQSQGAEKDSD